MSRLLSADVEAPTLYNVFSTVMLAVPGPKTGDKPRNHQNNQQVRSAQALVEADGHYLEADTSLGDALGDPEDESAFEEHTLEALQAEAKYLHNAVISSLRQPQLIRCCFDRHQSINGSIRHAIMIFKLCGWVCSRRPCMVCKVICLLL